MAEYLSKFTGARVDSAVEKIPATLPTEDSSIIVISKDGTTGYTTLSSLGAGDVVAAGNNAFTGNNTFAGTSTFNGDVTMAKTPTIPGYANLAGENTFTGSNTFSGDVTISKIPNITGYAALAGANTFTGSNTFQQDVTIGTTAQYVSITSTGISKKASDASSVLSYDLPNSAGILALTTDIASAVAGLASTGSSNSFSANNYFAYNKGIDIGEKSVAPPWLAIRNDNTVVQDKVAFFYHDGNAENTQNVAYFPAQSGVIALTPMAAPTETSFVTYGTDFKPQWVKGSDIPDAKAVTALADRLDKIETLLAPGLAAENARAIYWLLAE